MASSSCVAFTVTQSNNNVGTNMTGLPNVTGDTEGPKTVDQWFNKAAFSIVPSGTFGNEERNSIRGPGFWKADLAISRLFSFATSQNVEVRLEAFNLLNNFNWGNPGVNFAAGTFGRITTQAGAPRIMQFGVKYGF